jgi:hypothetical protein
MTGQLIDIEYENRRSIKAFYLIRKKIESTNNIMKTMVSAMLLAIIFLYFTPQIKNLVVSENLVYTSAQYEALKRDAVNVIEKQDQYIEKLIDEISFYKSNRN